MNISSFIGHNKVSAPALNSSLATKRHWIRHSEVLESFLNIWRRPCKVWNLVGAIRH